MDIIGLASGDVFSFGYNARGQCGRAAVQSMYSNFEKVVLNLVVRM